jgi:hypothetical protein
MSTPPQRRLVESIMQSLDRSPPKTLGDVYRGNQHHPWPDFLAAVDYMISRGYLEGRGDGSVVNYSLTAKGRRELKPTADGVSS